MYAPRDHFGQEQKTKISEESGGVSHRHPRNNPAERRWQDEQLVPEIRELVLQCEEEKGDLKW